MSPVVPPARLETEAARALVGLWLLIVSLAGAQPAYRWLDHSYPNHPGLSLLSALGLAAIACTGLGLVFAALFRAVIALIAPRPLPARAVTQG